MLAPQRKFRKNTIRTVRCASRSGLLRHDGNHRCRRFSCHLGSVKDSESSADGGQLDWLISGLPPREGSRFAQRPKIEPAIDSVLENEEPSVWGPAAATCVQDLVESCPIRGGLHDCHRVGTVIKLAESEAPSIRGKSKVEGNTVGGKEFPARGTVPIHREHVMTKSLPVPWYLWNCIS